MEVFNINHNNRFVAVTLFSRFSHIWFAECVLIAEVRFNNDVWINLLVVVFL